MHCDDVKKRMDAWIDGELAPEESQEIDRHLRGCSGCRREAEDLGQIVTALAELPTITAPSRLTRKTRRAFVSGLERPDLAQWWRELSLTMRGAVCGAVAAGLLFGVVLGTTLVPSGAGVGSNPYQTLYASRGIFP